MTKARTATDEGLEPHYKVRLVVAGALIHLTSWDRPRVTCDPATGTTVEADWITEGYGEAGDTLGFVDPKAITAVSWRWSP